MSKKRWYFSRGLRIGALILTIMAPLIFLFSACGRPTSQDDTLVVAVDSTRLAGVQLYQKTHPNVKLQIEIADRGTFPQKFLLYNQAGGGWPDVIFAEPNIIARLADSPHHYPADLTSYVPKSILQNFAPGSSMALKRPWPVSLWCCYQSCSSSSSRSAMLWVCLEDL